MSNLISSYIKLKNKQNNCYIELIMPENTCTCFSLLSKIVKHTNTGIIISTCSVSGNRLGEPNAKYRRKNQHLPHC